MIRHRDGCGHGWLPAGPLTPTAASAAFAIGVSA